MKEKRPLIATKEIIFGHFLPCSWATSDCWIRLIIPEYRASLRFKGLRQKMINQLITDTLAPSLNQLGIKNLYLICDKSSSHTQVDMMWALHAGKCYCVNEILYMPTRSAKYWSPFDNPLWHSFKETIRNRHPLISIEIPVLLFQTFYSLLT